MVTTAVKQYTFEEYCHYDDDTDNRYELVLGCLEIMTPPSFRHILISDKIRDALTQEIKRLEQPLFCLKETGVRTGWRKSRIVDLLVVPQNQVMESLDQAAICQEPPLMAIEIVSPESVQRDYRYKRSEYAALEIPEYWIVDPDEQKITVLTFKVGLYDEIVFRGEQAISSGQFPELKLTVNQILNVG